jgi:uncharacterized protein YndB with AHSA1/START domain
MSRPTVTHGTFTIERRYAAAPARVFAAWSDPAQKAAWFRGPDDWTRGEHALDFRVGGREVNEVTPPAGPRSTFEARYLDIVPDERIIYSYEMRLDETLISVSLATVQLASDGAGTRLTFTEQAAFLTDDDDPPHRRLGMAELLDRLGAALSDTPARST